MLRACVIDFDRNWEKSIPLVEFNYNNSYQSSIEMPPFEALYGRRCRTPLCWSELGENKKKVLRFGEKGKLSPRYISPFEVIERIGPVAYRLSLPPEFDKIHNVFHVSMLRRYRSDPSHILEPEEVELNPNLSYKEEPVQILDWEVKRLRNKNISLVKVLWRNHKVEEATWEPEDTMREQHPHLFDLGKNAMTNSLLRGGEL
ncbi:hypothetical protein V6N13_006272 [Hibiscus sabdariffa]